MNESKINGRITWNFSINNEELKFDSFDKSKILFTNRLNF